MAKVLSGPREIGRPRSFEDETIYFATASVLASVGNEHLTLALIAEKVGCSAPALVQRFGSKRALLKGYMNWSMARTRQRFEQVEEHYDSPLECLKARVSIPRSERPDELSNPEGYPSAVFFHLASWNDPEFQPLVEERRMLIEGEIQRLLTRATESGEISGVDEARMAQTMVTAFTGAALQSIALETDPIENRLADLVDDLLAPYRTP